VSASEVADRWARVADGFSARVDGVAPGAWDAPAPCAGWVARDVVGHLVEWVPPFLGSGTGVELTVTPSVDDEPAAAWHSLRSQIDAILADPDVTRRRFEHPRAGSHSLDDAIEMFVTGDVLVHTWDLARATGQDETLDAEAVHAQLVGLEALPPGMLAESGQYGPAVVVDPDADEQTRMLALTGRDPRAG
jgi:uncharacterized protein (TIGR03086 family)